MLPLTNRETRPANPRPRRAPPDSAPIARTPPWPLRGGGGAAGELVLAALEARIWTLPDAPQATGFMDYITAPTWCNVVKDESGAAML